MAAFLVPCSIEKAAISIEFAVLTHSTPSIRLQMYSTDAEDLRIGAKPTLQLPKTTVVAPLCGAGLKYGSQQTCASKCLRAGAVGQRLKR